MTLLDLLKFKRWGYVSDANRPVLVRSVILANLRVGIHASNLENKKTAERMLRLALSTK